MGTNVAGTGKTVNAQLEAAETEWEIAPGHLVPGYGFNGQLPAPIGADAGDTLVGELTNALPEPTSIPWRGRRVPAEMDSTQLVQQSMQPGERFEFRSVLPDAGTFWYHPHINEAVQLEKSLHWALVVSDVGEPRLDGERVLVLDDLKLDRKGNLAWSGGFQERHEGRRGDARLVNGGAEPEFEISVGLDRAPPDSHRPRGCRRDWPTAGVTRLIDSAWTAISFPRTDPGNFTVPRLSRAAQAEPRRGSPLARRTPA